MKWLFKISSAFIIYLSIYLYVLVIPDKNLLHILFLLLPFVGIFALAIYSIYFVYLGVASHSYDDRLLQDLMKDLDRARNSLESRGFKFTRK
ncbi:hypothetical protein BMR1_02g03851 [Babesia microti strain RI]|uniref:Dolichol-phosphate mannosyltransferase subunit 3 n=1 Tax=Babesia microti (strain RI) TaxID=1133968 RepID=A0A1R4AAY2_BABMR|nr:hypothetical protein BMR1_02g03851 [Babesia microti strain RI]SJK86145.1 hypothetical protein BMR1_02g03851 [Babesia microti strain RI]|eukprot:XP_021338338.1 hypothetical protein BMR1_02g03851 [Babesia microti strain RI]